MSTTLSRALSAALIQRLHLVVEQASAALLQVQQLRSVSTSAAQHDGKRKDTSSSRRGRGSKQQPTPSAPPTPPARPVDLPPRIGRVAPVTVLHKASQQQVATSTVEHDEAGQEGAPEEQGQDFTTQLANRLLRQRAAAMTSGRAKPQTPSTVAAVLQQTPGSSRFTPEALAISDISTFTDYLHSARMGAPSVFDLGLTVAQGRPMRAWLLRWERLLRTLQPHEAADPAALSGEQLEAAAGRSGVQGADGKAVEDAIMEWVFFRRCCELLSLQRQLLRSSVDRGPPSNVQQLSNEQGLQQDSQQQQPQQQSLQPSQQPVQLPAEDVHGWQAWFFDWTLDDYASYLAAAQQGAPTIFSAGVSAAEWQEETAEKLAQSTQVLSALVGAERARPLFMSSACLRDMAATAGVPAATARAVLDDFYKLKRLGFTVAAQQLLQATGQSSQAQQQWQPGSDLEASSSQHSQDHQHDTPHPMAADPATTVNSATAPTVAPMSAQGDDLDAADNMNAAKHLVLQQLQAAASMGMEDFATFLQNERQSGRRGMGAGSRSARLAMLRIQRIIQAMTPAEKAAVEEAAAAAQQQAAAGEDAASAFLLSQEQQRRIAARCGAGVSAVEVGDVLEQYIAMRKAAAETLQEQLELAGSDGT